MSCDTAGATENILYKQYDKMILLARILLHASLEPDDPFPGQDHGAGALHKRVNMMNPLQQLFEQSTDAVFGIDEAGVVRYTNSGFEKLLGYSREQARDRPCAGLLCGTDMQGREFCGPRCPIPRSLAGKAAGSDFELVVKRADGDTLMTNIGACYTPPQLRAQAGGVSVFFSLRRVSCRRLLQRMSAPAGEMSSSDMMRARARLTHREREILGMAAAGMNTLTIADRLYISKQTVRSHFKNIYRKLGVHTRTDAVVFTMQNLLT